MQTIWFLYKPKSGESGQATLQSLQTSSYPFRPEGGCLGCFCPHTPAANPQIRQTPPQCPAQVQFADRRIPGERESSMACAITRPPTTGNGTSITIRAKAGGPGRPLFSSRRQLETVRDDVVPVDLMRAGVAHSVVRPCGAALVDRQARRAIGFQAVTVGVRRELIYPGPFLLFLEHRRAREA